jgi:hypothetical protein
MAGAAAGREDALEGSGWQGAAAGREDALEGSGWQGAAAGRPYTGLEKWSGEGGRAIRASAASATPRLD